MNVLFVIPARYASTRLPGKPLLMLGRQTLIERVYRQVEKVTANKQVVVATDDVRIADTVTQFGGQAMLTGVHHLSGTDRCAEAARLHQQPFDLVVNVQGDEPFMHPESLECLLSAFDDPQVHIATLYRTTTRAAEATSPQTVKVVLNHRGNALYFSRYAIPFRRQATDTPTAYKLHQGVYAFRPAILQQVAQLPPGQLEQAESLEQLRWLEHGYHIRCMETPHPSVGIDTPEDLETARQHLRTNPE